MVIIKRRLKMYRYNVKVYKGDEELIWDTTVSFENKLHRSKTAELVRKMFHSTRDYMLGWCIRYYKDGRLLFFRGSEPGYMVPNGINQVFIDAVDGWFEEEEHHMVWDDVREEHLCPADKWIYDNELVPTDYDKEHRKMFTQVVKHFPQLIGEVN